MALIRSGKPLDLIGDADEGENQPQLNRPGRRAFLHVARPEKEIGPVARNLMRRASEEFLDRGLSVLYVSFGMLRWKDTDGVDMASPLYLIPVELVPEGPRATPRLRATDDDPALNPALALRLADFGVQFPGLEDVEELNATDIMKLFEGTLAKAKNFTDWEVHPEVHLALFSFSKEAMYRDLLDNEDRIAAHPIVEALANTDPKSQTDAFQFEAIDPAEIDTQAPPELTPLVLDADSSQRAAVAAAGAGRSFVMDGPPGTGKSQTIANMIGSLIHEGKTVLFVSEKIAALEVVKNRLEDAGLGSYLLELHSHKTNRREVALELLKTLENEAQPPQGLSQPSRRTVEENRKKLNQYALAMNEQRSPLERTLHDVLGDLAELAALPAAPLPTRSLLKLDQAAYAGFQASLRRLSRAWRPAIQGRSFLWRGVTEEESLETRLWSAESALKELQGAMSLNRDLTVQFELDQPRNAPQLVSLLDLQHASRPQVVIDEWLLSPNWQAIEQNRNDLAALVETLASRANDVVRLSNHSYKRFTTLVPESARRPADVDSIDTRPISGAQLRETSTNLRRHEENLKSAQQSLEGLAHTLGLPTPTTWADADRVIRLVQLRASGAVVESSWLTPAGLQSTREAYSSIRLKAIELEAAEDRAQTLYRPEALSAPLHELRDRFDNLHKGLRKLSRDYRRDKKSVASLLSDAKQIKSGISRLSEAVTWADARREFEATGVVHAQHLKRHWQARETDWERLERAIDVAEEVIALSGGAVTPETTAYFVATEPNSAHATIAAATRDSLTAWRQSLAPAPALSGRPALLLKPIQESMLWISANIQAIDDAATLIQAVSDVTGTDHTHADAVQILDASATAKAAADELEASRANFDSQFGSLFAGAETDIAAIDSALSWAKKVRSHTQGGVLTAAQHLALMQSSPVTALPSFLSNWEQARDSVLAAFSSDRGEELLEDMATFAGAMDLFTDLGADTVGQQEWFDYLHVREELKDFGVEAAVDFCVEKRISETNMPKVVERAVLRSWSDIQIKRDNRLQPLLSTEREALVREFQKLDRELVAAATGDIIRAANKRRPNNISIGEPALIRREGLKQRRHMPVRGLISQARTAVQAIKPVFMMSPLAVSQYLPSDMNFDVVIFDEASQVTPADSINCIYRGHAFILAGDDKQLPPSQFFERAVESDDDSETDADVKDFQSILELAKSAGAFQNLGLRWHYRSRHEGLIAFSNYRFYDGRLITYPSAQEDGDDVGVEFIAAGGTYRRGGGADNPKEARVVAERVIHHYRTRPSSSLGVVTFSVAQADAVMAAVNTLRESNRDLDGYFDKSDRLDGFFVRSLESVQGDERDVIIFSIGYGPDEAGKISTNFGVLNKEKGWRRLNVGITRARQRIEIVSSMSSHDIPASQNENVEALRAYLDFAQRGIKVLGTQSSVTGLMPESPFEESVIRTIESWGYSVEPQVGAAGFRIDLAIRHPEKPGMFALGVECDGYQYHSSPAARDRDRLRDQVLVGLGWTLHRIWGTAWYRDRNTEEQRLRSAIESAVAGRNSPRTAAHKRVNRPVIETIPTSADDTPSWATRYTKAVPSEIPSYIDPGEPLFVQFLVEPLRALVEVEGPVHMDIISERIREWWSIGRVSARVRENLFRAIAETPHLTQDGDFILAKPEIAEVRCIDSSRKPHQVHPGEFALATVHLLGDVGAASRDEITTHIARLFGWTRRGALVEERIQFAIDELLAKGVVQERDGRLSSLSPGIKVVRVA